MTLTANIIGAGNLGKTLGFLLNSHNIQIRGVCNRSIDSAKNAAAFIRAEYYTDDVNQLPQTDFVFITTPDSVIESVCNELSKRCCLKKGCIVIHCSGVLTSDILSSIKQQGYLVASAHPMRSFANPLTSVKEYAGTYCAIEADVEAQAQVTYLFELIGSVTYCIAKEKKALYHASGVFASNYLVTLAQQALSCLEEACVDKEMAIQIISNLMKGTVANLERTLSPVDSLTGPIKRGDVSTVNIHLDSFQTIEQKTLYAQLGLATMPLASLDKKTTLAFVELFRLL